MTVLLHLSDIHFRKRSGDPLDIDEDLRNELLLDAADVSKRLLGPPDAILVGGDLAYSGHPDEYAHAKKFLNELAERVGTTLAGLWCVPGNHDVDQTCIRQSPILLDMQHAIRAAAPAGVDKKLLDYLSDPLGRVQLYRSITAFNAFAEPFGFDFAAERPHHHIDLSLNDGYRLRVHGLNSTLVSNHLDNEVKCVVLGRHQLPKREPGVINLVLCHHPPDWWSDDDSVGNDMQHRAHIQLYGHKHIQVMQGLETSLRLSAGAVHPSRDESQWRPRYNWLKLAVKTTNEVQQLTVTVFPRVWGEAEPKFIGDFNLCGGKESKSYTYDLETWLPSVPAATTAVKPAAESSRPSINGSEPVTMSNPIRILTYRLFELPYITRVAIAQKLDLLRNEDAGLKDYEVFRRVLQRATDDNKLAALWREVQEKHNDGKFTENPFEKKEGGA